LFRTREQAQESLDHFDAYLFLYAFTWNAFSDVWPGEIPPGWELEWVEDDY
jgi:hypothetical protein